MGRGVGGEEIAVLMADGPFEVPAVVSNSLINVYNRYCPHPCTRGRGQG